jgi:hypothetical protein
MRRTIALATTLVLSISQSWAADTYVSKKHRHRHASFYVEQPVYPSTYYGGRLVMHPAENIACNKIDRATRALPCDQPVWVYGSPCEIDLGLGRSRPCD